MAGQWGLFPWGVGSWGLGTGSGLNLGFEDAGPDDGIPDQWSLVPAITGLMRVRFDEGTVADSFDWFGEEFVDELVPVPVTFDSGSDPSFVETFSWVGELVTDPALVSVTFGFGLDPGLAETFESYWDDNQDWLTDFVGVGTDLTAVSFTGPSPHEDWESGWDDNEDWLTDFVGVGTDLVAVSFDGAVPETVEDFEEVRIPLQFFVDATTDLVILTDPHDLADDALVTFSNDLGALPAPLLEDPTPFYIDVSASNTFHVRYIPGGSWIDILDYGAGVHTMISDRSLYWTDVIEM